MPNTDEGGTAQGHIEAASATPRVAAAPIAQAGQARVARIESLRALGAVGVVMAHVFGATVGEYFDGFHNRLAAGVGFGAYFFFAVSGCLLYMPFARRDFGDGSRVDLRRYGLNRVVRILPLYYVGLLVVLLMFQGGGSLEQWVRWGLFLENFEPSGLMAVNGVLWTIVIELHFYILLPFIAWGIARISRGSVKRAMLVIGGLGLASLAVKVFAVTAAGREWLDPLRFSLPATFFLIAAGMMVALVRESWSRGRPSWVRGWLASPDVWLLASVPLWLAFVADYDLEPLFPIACFLVLGAAVLPLEHGRLVRALDWRPVALLGITTYSLYIWHTPLIRAIETWHIPVVDDVLINAQELFNSDYLGMLVVVVPLACAVGALSYALIEAPTLRLRKRWGGYRSHVPESRRRSEPAVAPEPAPAGQAATP